MLSFNNKLAALFVLLVKMNGGAKCFSVTTSEGTQTIKLDSNIQHLLDFANQFSVLNTTFDIDIDGSEYHLDAENFRCTDVNNLNVPWQEERISKIQSSMFSCSTIDDVDMLSVKERDWLLQASGEACSNDADITQLLLAIYSYQHRALRTVNGDVSYLALIKQIELIRHQLSVSTKGEANQYRLAILARDPLVIISAIIAALFERVSFLVVDVKLPDARKQYMLNHSDANLLIESDAVVTLITDKSAVFSADAAYVVYTSGTTGNPKAIEVTRANIAAKLATAVDFYRLHESDHTLCMLNAATDTYLQQVLISLIAGAPIYFADDAILDPDVFLTFCQTHKITFTDLPPSFCMTLLEIEQAKTRWHKTSLRYLVLGGEELNKNILLRWAEFDLFNKCQLINEYGPSEATITSLMHVVTEKDIHKPRVPIGKPTRDTKAVVLDDRYALVGAGLSGELWLCGNGISNGYYNDVEKTSDRFKKLSIDNKESIYYRTGDVCNINELGEYTFLGRSDNQIQIYGKRIELEEIEANLLAIDHIADAAVVVVDQTIHAFVVSSVHQFRAEEIKANLKERVPHFCIPHFIKKVDALPKTPIGKIDRNALKLEVKNNVIAFDKNATPKSLLMSVLQQVIGAERLNTQLSFTQLGGDSILAIAVVLHLKSHQLFLDVAELLGPTKIEDLSIRSGQSTRINITDEAINILMPNKRSILAFDGINQWVIELNLRVLGFITSKAVERVVRIVIRKHPALKLHFGEKVHLCDHVYFKTLTAPADVPYTTWKQSQTANLLKEMNVATKPWSVVLYEKGAQKEIGIFVNHLLVDDVSLLVITNTINHLLANPQRFDRTIDQQLFIWQQQLYEKTLNNEFEEDMPYWCKATSVQNKKLLQMEDNIGLNQVQYQKFFTLNLLTAEQLCIAKKILSSGELSMFDFSITCVTKVLENWLEDSEFCLSTDVNGRAPLSGCPDINSAVGWFSASVPLYLQASHQADLIEQIAAIKKQYNAMPKGGSSFGWLMNYAMHSFSGRPQRLRFAYENHNIYNGNEVFDVRSKELTIQEIKADCEFDFDPKSLMYYLFDFQFVERNTSGLQLRVNYPSKLVDPETINNMIARFNATRDQLMVICDLSVDELAMAD
jgi:acyl-coenzyme A synthetase/AMP-(fatty) acid ligase